MQEKRCIAPAVVHHEDTCNTLKYRLADSILLHSTSALALFGSLDQPGRAAVEGHPGHERERSTKTIAFGVYCLHNTTVAL